ncbi:MAG: acetate--CoA ligase family protein, partial [Desulfatibacillaceae bacterium]|nr:acetate--CoA ligase family protein [Desulfatibacillaceae bacterium]
MDFFFAPKGIALIGATRKLKGGYAILYNLKKGFNGPVYPINPRYDEIDGTTCYPSVADVPDPVDLAIVFIPAPKVPAILLECAKRGIKGAMIESAGFAETGPEGKKLQDEIIAIAKETGLRLWGPNCMGLVDAKAGHVFSFVSPTIWDEGLIKGDVSLIVQSGMLSGGFLTDTMTHGTMGVSKVCSIGNKADVSEIDLLEYMIDDPKTGAVAAYLESLPQGRRFMELCRRSPKPIVVLKGGKSEKGAQAAMSHTASMAGNGAVIAGALAQAGVVEAVDFKQMMDLARTVGFYPDIKADQPGRIAILTYSGGAGIMSADFLDEFGLKVADLAPKTIAKLATVYPEWMPPNNPVDLWPGVEKNGGPIVYSTALEAVAHDENVDAILMHAFVGRAGFGPDMEQLVDIAQKAGKPIFVWLIGGREEARKLHQAVQAKGVPVYRELYRAVECMAAAFNRGKMQASVVREQAPVPEPSGKLKGLLAGAAGVMDEHISKKILAQAGIPVVEEKLVASLGQALDAAKTMGFPLVAKGMIGGQVHKTEKGLVHLNITDSQGLEKAFDKLINAGAENILVQKQCAPGVEIIAGLVRDPQFGPCVMVGLGGVYAEVLNDRAFALAPLAEKEALALIDRLAHQKLLNGFRGLLPVDRKALASTLVALSQLGMQFEEIAEIDINPLIAAPGGLMAVDAS